MLYLIAFGMFILIFASTWWFGLWSNIVTLINLFIASMVASSLYQPMAGALGNVNSSYQDLYEFIGVWLVFCLALFVLRGVTDTLSRFRLKFDPMTELIGRSIVSAWIAGVFICFSFFTMQMAPLTPAFYGSETQATDPASVGTLPDKLWLAFIQSRSRGALAAGQSPGAGLKEYTLGEHPDDVGMNKRVFDPYGQFLLEMENRRWKISKKERLRNATDSGKTKKRK